MNRSAWMGRILPRMQAEYRQRHDGIRPEILQLLKDSGISSAGTDVSGYYAKRAQPENPIVGKQITPMQDVPDLQMDAETDVELKLGQMFFLA